MNFNRTNNIVGWVVCTIACAVYILTMEATGSFWDCGEFISSCYKLQIPHPPGSPLFIMMGRFFIVLFGDNPMTAARAVNFMSAMASGFTILFLFWSITHFARKIIEKNGQPLSKNQLFVIMSAGVVGALAYTFSDSFWFSAVEGEVYATSSLFTALVFWAILKWEQKADEPGADRWLIFIFFMMGLSIGVHLLNLLTIPAIVMVYYFRRYKFTLWGTAKAFVIGCVITGVVLKYVIQYTIKGAGWVDVQFVNGLGMPFFVGFIFFFVLLGAAVYCGIQYAVRRKYYFLKIGLWGFAFMMLGYSTYMTTMIRSNADPAIDMFNVDNPVSLVRYLGREQYGDWPIVYGPDYTDNPPRSDGGELYVKGKNKYEAAGKIYNQDWTSAPSAHLFPRMWSNTNDRNEIDFYRQYGGVIDDQPTMADNFRYFMKYQVGWMYFRYFMWNFAGKQNDLQGFGNVRDSNWISGIPLIDNAMYHNQSKLSATVHEQNLSYNRLFMLPLLLGLAGLLFQYLRNKKDLIVNVLLFFFTGLGIVIYINQAGAQPRERDYSYAGSFYAFAIWIGLGVVWLDLVIQRWVKAPSVHYLSAGICLLAVPVLMASQEWNDHDRSHKTLARDMAKDYLESCPPNAILISSEDNDTYPLWYAQEVEGIRPDVRIAITTLLGSDWYMNQLRYKINKSAPADVIFTPEQIAGFRREVILFSNNIPGYDKNNYYDLYGALKNVAGSDDPKFTTQTEDGDTYNLLPTKKFSVPVDLKKVQANATVKPGDHVVNELHIDLPKGSYILKGDLTILSLIAANKWERPICFTNENEAAQLGLAKYVRSNGLAYRLVPVENDKVDNEVAYKNVMEKFAYGNASHPGVYFDEENRHRMNIIKLSNAELAMSLAEAGDKEKARRILENFDRSVRESNIPYGMTSSRGNQHDAISTQFLSACYLAEDLSLARRVSASLKKDLREQLIYYRSLGESDMSDEQLANAAYLYLQGKGNNLADDQVPFASDIVSSFQMLRQVAIWEKAPANSPHISEKQ
ncbi:MAG: DUF2723 domain-containing protein [Bacteroidetes bacterium]|nr:MAG: DUF2723 domain-containing protein [Bacteroidota bacterium]